MISSCGQILKCFCWRIHHYFVVSLNQALATIRLLLDPRRTLRPPLRSLAVCAYPR